MACRPFEGPLRLKKLFGGKKCWVRLYRGTLSISNNRLDRNDETVLTRETVYYHLSLAEIIDGKTPNPYRIKMRLHDGVKLNFRIPVKSGPQFREEWIRSLKCHIAYANRCIGMCDANPGSTSAALLQLSNESRDRVRSLEESLTAFNLALRNIQPRLLNSDVTQNLHNVTGASEKAYRSLKDFYDALMQENQKREEELVFERERVRLAEEAVERLTQMYNALIISAEKRSVGTNRSSRTSSEYFTPAGSIRGYEETLQNGRTNGHVDGLIFPKPSTPSFRPEDVDKIQAAARRRQIPRIASYGPMSVDGSIYLDAIPNDGYASATSNSDIFLDCMSVDSRSFIVSNGHAISNTPISAENPKSYAEVQSNKSFKSAKSVTSKSSSDAQSFKSALSEFRD